MSQQSQQETQKSILACSHTEALQFFLKSKSYFSLELPPYFTFDSLLLKLNIFLGSKSNKNFQSSNPRDIENINHTISSNKDGKYAWRPFQIIHPVLYVALVHRITEQSSWQLLCTKFTEFSLDNKISCLSIPFVSCSKQSDKATQVLQWWKSTEQKSIEMSLDYEYLFETDITDCYSSIYTHSIPWALHTKAVAKARRADKSLLGNAIDSILQDMNHGQTNGIAQGSVVMDFIAEMVLGYADIELSSKISASNIVDFSILRYRDDYRIFVNNPQEGEKILKLLTETMIDIGLKLSPSKTRECSDIVCASIKTDKRAWIFREKLAKTFQKRLLIIHDHSKHFPNSGSLVSALSEFYKRLLKVTRKFDDVLTMISIVVDIAYKNPKTYPICAGIISKLLCFVATPDERMSVIGKIKRKFENIPNTGHMQIWLQRVTYPIDKTQVYDEMLCKCLNDVNCLIWDTSWISSNDLKRIISDCKIIDKATLDSINNVIPFEDIQLFLPYDR